MTFLKFCSTSLIFSTVNLLKLTYEVMREADANETSIDLGSAFGGTLVGLSQLIIP